jgi:hypothetical protein
MQEYMKDFVERMREIKDAVESPDDQRSIEEKEALLEELVEIVESIDYARDLHKIGGLPTLLALLQSPHAGLRSRAAEVVAACTQNHPQVGRRCAGAPFAQPLPCSACCLRRHPLGRPADSRPARPGAPAGAALVHGGRRHAAPAGAAAGPPA